jgi:hypothetical protein
MTDLLDGGATIIGTAVDILENDFVEMVSKATVLHADTERGRLVLKLQNPVMEKGLTYPYAVASIRHEGIDLDDAALREGIGCNIIWVTAERFSPDAPFDVSWWRGGAVAISDVICADMCP